MEVMKGFILSLLVLTLSAQKFERSKLSADDDIYSSEELLQAYVRQTVPYIRL